MTISTNFVPLFSADIVPYYNFQLTEGVFVPSRGDWAFSVDLLNNIGVIVRPVSRHSVVGFLN